MQKFVCENSLDPSLFFMTIMNINLLFLMFQAQTVERSSTFVCSYMRICRQFKMVFLGHPELRTFFVLKVFKLVTHHHYNSVAWIAGTTSNFLQDDFAISLSLT